MTGRGEAPARTEADISAALAELAQRAPSADAVLTAVRKTRANGHQGSPPAPGPRGLPGTRQLAALIPRLQWPQLAVTGAVAATAMVLAIVVTLGSAPLGGAPVQAHRPVVFPPIGSLPTQPGTGPPGGAPAVMSPSRAPSSVLVAEAMLAAFNATADDLVFETPAGFTKGHLSGTHPGVELARYAHYRQAGICTGVLQIPRGGQSAGNNDPAGRGPWLHHRGPALAGRAERVHAAHRRLLYGDWLRLWPP